MADIAKYILFIMMMLVINTGCQFATCMDGKDLIYSIQHTSRHE